jgi:hypothetical protein
VGGNGTAAGFMPQGRYTNTYQFSENANLMWGNHQIQAGGSWQRNRVNPHNFAGRYPTVTLGFSATAPAGVQLTSAMFPGGISAADLSSANAMAAMLGGIVSSVARTFQVENATSGYVPGFRRTSTTRSTTSPCNCRTIGGGSPTSRARGRQVGIAARCAKTTTSASCRPLTARSKTRCAARRRR